MTKVENILKRTCRFGFDDFESDYETLLYKSVKYRMQVGSLTYIALEAFPSLNNLNSSYLQKKFIKRNKT